MRGHHAGTPLGDTVGSQPSANQEASPYQTLPLGLPGPRTARVTFPLFRSHRVCGVLLPQPDEDRRSAPWSPSERLLGRRCMLDVVLVRGESATGSLPAGAPVVIEGERDRRK